MVALTICILIGLVGQGPAVAAGEPPTRGVERNTAHTLRANELQIGFLFTQAYEDLYVEAGISDDVQIGVSVLTTLGGQPYGWIHTSNRLNDELLMGAALGLRYRPGRSWPPRPNYLYGDGGFCFSFIVSDEYSLHAGLHVRTRVNLDAPRVDYVRYSPYAVVDADIAEGFVLLGEVAYEPTYIRVGALMQAWEMLDLKASVNILDLSMQLGADLRIKLGRAG